MQAFNRPRIRSRELADLSRLADGTIDPARRAGIEERIASSPELRDLYARERRVVAALQRTTATERAPERLRARIEANRPRPGGASRRRVLYGGVLTAAALAVVLLVVLVLPAGSPGAPSVSEAAALAFRGSTASAPAPDPRAPETKLSLSVQRLHFPNWSIGLGWAAVGQRADRLSGREVVTVYYEGHGSSVAYTIVSGSALSEPPGKVSRRSGQRLRTLSIDGRLVLTWLRAGHTCVLSGTGVTAEELERLATWRYGGASR